MAPRRRALLGALGALSALVVVASLSSACEPTFKREGGSITIDGKAFEPATCHVLVGATGLALSDAAGARLVLTLPPARLDAFRELQGKPLARYEVPGSPAVDLGSCGALTLRGEGYHGQSKRAASGSMSLACKGAATVKGDLTFAGCF